MEKNRKRLILLSVCLFIIITLLTIRANTSWFFPPQQPFIFALNEQDIISLTLTGEQKKQTIVKDKTKWIIKKDSQTYNADADKVQTLIKTLNGITKETIVSNNINRHIELEIGIQSIVINTPSKKDTIYIGKEYMGGARYAKLNNEDVVFLGNSLASILLDEDFRDLKTHLLMNESQIKSISINSDEGEVLLVKKKNDWMVGERKALINPVTYFLDSLKNLTASDIIDSPGNALDNLPILTIKIVESKQEYVIQFYQYKEGVSIIKSPRGTSIYYLIPDVYVSSLQKQEADFFE